MSTLMRILDHIGFNARPQQVALFEALEATDEVGSVVQAGTGTGKSLAVLAAAADWARRTGQPSLVVVPTNILLQQYTKLDAPRVEQALGITIKSLMGRNRYLCSSAPGFAGLTRLPDQVIAAEPEQNQLLHGDEIVEAADPYWFGCPGSDECRYKEDGETCHYRMAKEELPGADIIITNAHLLIIDDQLKSKPEGPAQIFPDFGALFVDECHTLEDSLRSFATRSIPRQAVLGLPLASWLRTRVEKDALTITPDRYLVEMLSEVRGQDPLSLKKHQKEAKQAAEYILQRGANGAYREGEAVLWLDPPHGHGGQPRLVSTQINLAGGARRILTKVPFGLVSGTVPGSLRNALSISDAAFIDVGHPFDYSKQVELKISPWSGAYKQSRDLSNVQARVGALIGEVTKVGGGALCLFSSYLDMGDVFQRSWHALKSGGLDVRSQTRDGDNKELGEWFKSHGNAVLFGTESFATGFDVPGEALRLVAIWKLPYPGLDPVTRAISNRSRRRYEDMMLMKVTQAAGRLIRTAEDTGTVFIADSRAQEKLLDRDDPMIAHFNDMAYTPRAAREDY